jgi:predicted TIM-barrel fold metal-dependent hydrolase
MIIDAHTHVGEIAAFDSLDCRVSTMLALMDAVDIDMAVQMPTAGIVGEFEAAYEIGEAAFDESAGRLVYGLTYDPNYPEDSMRWLNLAAERPGFVGCKIHPSFHQVWPADARYEPVWRFAAERAVPITAHSWALSSYNPVQKYATPDQFAHYAEQLPDVNFILGHAGGRYSGHLAALELAQRYPNVSMDISGDSYPFGFIEWLVAGVGADRILFGSDVNWIDPRTHLGRIYDADITLEEKKMILGENACRLFRLDGRCPAREAR